MDILHREDLPLGGFAGLREHQLVMDPQVFGGHASPRAWSGIGSFVYLADARFLPRGETRLHGHREVDVISVMADGRIAHEGSLQHGQELRAFQVQVQRAGDEGFQHNEVNPDDQENRMIQIWVLPETLGEPAGYKLYSPEWGGLTRVYGGPTGQAHTYPARTIIEVALLEQGQKISIGGPSMMYLVQGAGAIHENPIGAGDLVRGDNLSFEALDKTQFIAIHLLRQ